MFHHTAVVITFIQKIYAKAWAPPRVSKKATDKMGASHRNSRYSERDASRRRSRWLHIGVCRPTFSLDPHGFSEYGIFDKNLNTKPGLATMKASSRLRWRCTPFPRLEPGVYLLVSTIIVRCPFLSVSYPSMSVAFI